MQPFSCVLFDLDGTLVDTNHLILTSFQQTLADQLGLQVTPPEIVCYFGEPLDTTMRRFAPDRWEELVAHYRAHNQLHHDDLIRRFDGVVEMLERLKDRGVRRGVVTSKYTQLARRGARCCGVEDLLEDFVGKDMTEKHKPDPTPVLFALERLGVEPGPHVLMVGDSPFDILAGKAAGVRTCAVGWTVLDRSVLHAAGPDFFVETVAELEALCLRGG